MLLLVLFVGVVYLGLIVVLLVGWRRVRTTTFPPAPPLSVTVIIPFRNEAAHLPFLIEALQRQTYARAEFLFVDDHSTDGGQSVVGSLTNGDIRFRRLLNRGEGKKAAITTAVHAATSEIMVTTDADCVMGSDWLETLLRGFHHDRVMMVLGPVVLRHEGTWWSKCQQLEFLSLVGSAAAGVGIGYPFMCNGANLAYRKKAFEAVGGYADNMHVASGDDEFLMRALVSRSSNGVCFQVDKNSIVTTTGSATVKAFWFQRLRWAAKWKHNSLPMRALALGVLGEHAVFIVCMVMVVGSHDDTVQLLAGGVLLVKLLGEWALLKPIAVHWGLPWHTPSFITLQFIHSIYIVITGLFSNFMPNTWKGRAISK